MYSYLGVPNAGLSDFVASSIRGITIFSIESVRRENVGSTMKSMNPKEEEERKSGFTFPQDSNLKINTCYQADFLTAVLIQYTRHCQYNLEQKSTIETKTT